MHENCFCEYWKSDWNKVKPCWNDGFVLDIAKTVLWAIRKISISNWITFPLIKHGLYRWAYRAVDLYVIAWLIAVVGLSICRYNVAPDNNSHTVLLFVISYRLLDIFQTWIGNFFIGDPVIRYPHRTLMLTFIGYGEIILWYSILVYILHASFGISSFQESLYYASGTASIGTDIRPKTFVGIIVFSTQVMFAISFLAVVVNRIIALTK